jgi:hypothetical protein
MDGLRVSEEDDSECGGGVAILRRPRELHDQRDQVVLDAVVKVTRQAPALAGGARDPRPRELPSDIPRIDMPDRRRFREPLINTLVEGPPHTAVIALDERVDVASCVIAPAKRSDGILRRSPHGRSAMLCSHVFVCRYSPSQDLRT